MPTALPDVLSSDGRFIYMRSQAFDLNGKRLPLAKMPRRRDDDAGAPEAVQGTEHVHIFSPTGFLDDSYWSRTYWMYGTMFVSGWQGYYRAGTKAPAGRILVADDRNIYGYGRKPQYWRWTTAMEDQLFASPKRPDLHHASPNGGGNVGGDAAPKPPAKAVRGFAVPYDWTTDMPIYVRGLTLADGVLFLAGPQDLIDQEKAIKQLNTSQTQVALSEQVDAWAGKKGGLLWAVDAKTGSRRLELQLNAPPVFDGMAAANGRLYVATTDNHIVCLSGRQRQTHGTRSEARSNCAPAPRRGR